MSGAWLLMASTATGCAASHGPASEGEALERRLLVAQCLAELGPECVPRAFYTPTDVERCVQQRWPAIPLRRRDAIDEGRAVIDEDAVDACIAELGCHTRWRGICDHVTIGLTPIGGACAEDETCEPGSFCMRRGGCGTCEPLLAPGEVCRRSLECAASDEGFEVSCDVFGSETCLAVSEPDRVAGLGETCGRVIISPGYAAFVSCTEGLICSDQECVEGEPPWSMGVELVREIGGSCGHGVFRCDADLDLHCTYDDTCQPFASSEGASCGFDYLCGPERHCAFPAFRCGSELLEDGAPCGYDADCESRRCVLIRTSSRCLPRVSC